jgi:hypothetical protein
VAISSVIIDLALRLQSVAFAGEKSAYVQATAR